MNCCCSLEKRLARARAGGRSRRRCASEVAAAQGAYEARGAEALARSARAAAEALGKAVTAAMQQLAMAGGRFCDRAESAGRAAALRARRRSSSRSPSTPACRCGRWPRWPRAASCRASAWRSSWSRRRRRRSATLVFDEVDAGIGGAVAETVGRSLQPARQASARCCASPTCRRSRRSGNEQWSRDALAAPKEKVASQSSMLDRGARIAELARMLGGAENAPRASTRRSCWTHD